MVYFRAIPADWEMFLAKRHNRPENLSDQERREMLAQTRPGMVGQVAAHDRLQGAELRGHPRRTT